MTIKPVKEVKKKRSLNQQSQNEAQVAEEEFPEDNENIEIDQNIINDVYPYHYKPKRNTLKKLSKNSGGNSPRPHVSKTNTLNSEDIPSSTEAAAITTATSTTAAAIEVEPEECSGYNSGDEHEKPQEVIDWKKRDDDFEQLLKKKGLNLKAVAEDGACLFRAISVQIYGDENMHDIVRQLTMDYIQKNRDYFSAFVTENIDDYIKRKRDVRAHGNHIELQAISEVYNRPIELYAYETQPINIFNSDQLKNGYPPLRLSYQRNNHYNAIIDPYDATVGIGLGLPGLKPTLQTTEAIKMSEQLEIEKTMLEDKINTTDWEATNEAIEEQIARESYLEWLQQTLKKSSKSDNKPTATVTSLSAKVNLSPSYNSSSTSASDLEPSTSQGKLAKTNSNTMLAKESSANEDDTCSQKKTYKTKLIGHEQVSGNIEAKRLCNFDIRTSNEDVSSLPAPDSLTKSADDHLPSTSKQLSPQKNLSKNSAENTSPQKSSNLYEELLQASLECGEYNESEIFQRVLQMSTEDYLLQQTQHNSNSL